VSIQRHFCHFDDNTKSIFVISMTIPSCSLVNQNGRISLAVCGLQSTIRRARVPRGRRDVHGVHGGRDAHGGVRGALHGDARVQHGVRGRRGKKKLNDRHHES